MEIAMARQLLGVIVVASALSAASVSAQDLANPTASAPQASAQSSTQNVPPKPAWTATMFRLGGKLIDASDSAEGFYPKLGGMIPGAGIPVGPGYRHELFGGAILDSYAAISWRRYTAAGARLEWPRAFSNRVSTAIDVKYQDFTQINYFGIGNTTPKGNETDYRLKNTNVTGSVTVRPNEWLSTGARVGMMTSLRVQPGLSGLYPSIEQKFDEVNAPGLVTQPRYAHATAFIEANSFDVPGYPTRGGRYRVEFATFHDLDTGTHSFNRVDTDAVQHIAFLRDHQIVLHGRLTMSQPEGAGDIPFYLMPTLGGQTTLRGYADYRFRDRDAGLLSAEYRWSVFPAMDALLFTDGGATASSLGDLSRQRIHRDYGFGFRLHTATSSIAGLDVAKGDEGVRVLLTIAVPVGRGGRAPAPYVP
jgi:hypothetical protein